MYGGFALLDHSLLARVKVPRGIFLHSIMIKNQQVHWRTQNEQN